MASPPQKTLTRLHYTIVADAPHSHRIAMRLRIDDLAGNDKPVVLKMASWCPGSYLVRDYARFIRDVVVTDQAGNPLVVRKSAKHSWTIDSGHATSLLVSYRVYGYELSVRTNHIDDTHAFLHGPATYLYVEGRTAEPHQVSIELPPKEREKEREKEQEWTVVTGLPQVADETYRANDLDELLDCPIHLGEVQQRQFRAAGGDFSLAVWGDVARGKRGLDDLVADLAPIIEAHADRFGGLPFNHYTFILMLAPKAYGGLEHKNSSANLASSFAFAKDNSYTELLELLSHEFFHVWNGKRIYPQAFSPFDYDCENYTRGLWVMEGLTSYYDRYTLLRTGDLKLERYFEKLADEWIRLQTTPGRHHHSLEASSFDAWIKLYKPDASNINSTVSYYLKGGLVAATLDLLIRRQSDGQRSLSNVLGTLWNKYGATGIGYPEDVLSVFEEASGVGLSEPFDRWIRGTEDPDLADELAHLGIEMKLTPVKKAGYLGLRCADRPLRVSSVLEDSPAMRRGLAPGDEIIAADSLRVSTEAELKRRLEAVPPGANIELSLFRRHQLLSVTVPLETSPATRCHISTANEVTDEQKSRFTAWAGIAWPDESISATATAKRLL